MRRRERQMIGILLLIMLALLAVVVLRWGVASLDLWRARTIMKQVQTGGLTLTERQALVQTAMERLDQARKYDPGNPDILDQHGQFLYWQAMYTADVGSERAALLKQATEQYRASLHVRPLWPYTWGNLVVAKATSEGYQSISQAQILGNTCWVRPVLAHGYILSRNNKGNTVCLDVRS